MIGTLGIGCLFEFSRNEAIAGFLAPPAVFAAFAPARVKCRIVPGVY